MSASAQGGRPAIDRAMLARLTEEDGAAEVAGEVIALFLADTPAQLDDCRRAIADGELARLARLAHGLKGSAWIVGAMPLADLCAALERDAAGGHVAEPAALLEALVVEFERVRAVLERWSGGIGEAA